MSGLKVTELELEALRLRGDGLSNVEIADQLFVTVDAVKRRLWRAARKLGAHDTAHAIAECYRQGLIPLDVMSDAA